jgi:chaperonin GroEL
MVIVLQKRVASAVDMGDILTRAFKAKGLVSDNGQITGVVKLLLIGNIDAAAYVHAVNLINKGAMDAIILKTPPHYGDMGMQLLEDIAVYTGCEPISESTNLREIGSNHVGEIGRVVASKVESTLYGDNSGEIVQDRIAALKSQIETEAVDAIREKLKDRLAKLEGKIAIFRIGGTTETTKEELEFRVEDSILATRAAVSHGIVPGGGTTLLELSKTIGLSDLTRNALREVFKQLLINANLPEQVKLQEALDAKPGYGFNLREGDELVDLVKAGILDPTLVVENIIRNACEMAGNLLTIGAMIVHEEKEG